MRLRVREILQKRGMTAYGLAKASNGVISLNTAYRLARGEVKSISADVVDSLCKVLRVEPDELFAPRKPEGGKPRLDAEPRHFKGGQEYMGVWWKPENPDDKLSGTLRISSDQRAELTLIGSFREVKELDHFFEHPMLLGVAGKQITLVRCAEVGYNIASPGVVTTRYLADLVFLGALVPEPAGLALEQVYASYEYLGSWSRQSGYKHSYHHDEDKNLTGFTLTYTRPPVQAARVEGAQIRFVGGFHFGGEKWGELKAGQTVRLNVKPDSPTTFEQIRSRYLHPLQNLIAFGVGHPTAELNVNGTLADKGKRRHQREVEILFHRGMRGLRGTKALAPWDMLFTLADLREDLGSHLTNWLEKSKKLSPVFNLYFGTVFNPSMYGEHRFLSLAQAAESYHRLTARRQSILDSEKFDPLREQLCEIIEGADLPKPAADTYTSKLAFLNEIVLKDRLRELLSLETDRVKTMIPDPEAFIKDVATTRNYLTHFTKKNKDRAASGGSLLRVTEQLQYLLECRLLAELGFSGEKVEELMRRSHGRRYTRRVLSTGGE
jgi:DNA-binding Xre family transcriptional regulator